MEIRSTTLSLKAIAAQICVGTSKAANAKLHQDLRRQEAKDPGQARLEI
jgi:hypothetical protein